MLIQHPLTLGTLVITSVFLSTLTGSLADAEGETDSAALEDDGSGDDGSGDDGSEDDDLEQKLEAAEAKTAKAKQKAAKAESEADDAKDELARLKGGKLIRWGVTGGAGPAFHVPLHHGPQGRSMIAPSVPSVISYVMFHPAYWQNAPQQNIYCANIYTGASDEAAAQRIADQSARERTETLLPLLLDVAGSTPTKALTPNDLATLELLEDLDEHLYTVRTIVGTDTSRSNALSVARPKACRQYCKDTIFGRSATQACKGDCGNNLQLQAELRATTVIIDTLEAQTVDHTPLEDALEDVDWSNDGIDSIRALIDTLTRSRALAGYEELNGVTHTQFELARQIADAEKRGEDVEDAKDRLVELLRLDVVNWTPAIPGNCVARKFGLWIGYPLPFKVTIPVATTDEPPEYSRAEVHVKNSFAFGFGVSPNAYVSILTGFTIGTINLSDDDDREVVATWIFGIGGNLDLFTLLRGK